MKKFFISLSMVFTFALLFQIAATAQSFDAQYFAVQVVPPPQVEETHQIWMNSPAGQETLATGWYVFTGVYVKIPYQGAGDWYFAIYDNPTHDLGWLAAVAISTETNAAFFLSPSSFGYTWQTIRNNPQN